jgi:peptide/nickel transport system ATP-binding protein
MTTVPLLDIHDLTVEFKTRNGIVEAVKQVSFSVAKAETVGIVGESGSGKSVTSYAVLQILDRAGKVAHGSIVFSGMPLQNATETAMQDIRGREISMIFQNPRAALNPIRTVGKQIEDVLLRHAQATHATAKEKAIEALKAVKIAEPESRYNAYPYELSGGMCQRIVIAIALACRPQLLIADEPTTGLDVTTEKAVMELIVELTRSRGLSTIIITHNLALASEYCDRIVVMEKGRVIETADARAIFKAPRQAYTKKLMRATPRPGISLRDLLPEGAVEDSLSPAGEGESFVPSPLGDREREDSQPARSLTPLLKVENLLKEFPRRSAEKGAAAFRAVNGINFNIGEGESVGLVGESGCGKSTTSSIVMRLMDATSGAVWFKGRDIAAIPAKNFAFDEARSKLQMVFQDPTESLNPRFTAFRSIADPLYRLGGVSRNDEAREKVERLALLAGLPPELLDRFPHQLSGGQKARVGIARAIALEPKLLVLDEPTAALDVSVQAVVLNLLADLKSELGMSYLFVSHDLPVVRLLCDRVLVMKSGEIIEEGTAEQIMTAPREAYTRALLAAAPKPPV